MIYITDQISISEAEIKEDFIRASGPGGQNVNKVSSAVQLRFDITNSPSLSDEIKIRLIKLAGNRINEDGVLIIDSRNYRSQLKNREEALNRLIDLIRKASVKPKIRKKTSIPRAEKEKRLSNKKHRSSVKSKRKKVVIGE